MAEEKNRVGRPLKIKTVEELERKIEEYFLHCWTQKLDMFGNPIFLKDAKGKKTKDPVMVQTIPYTITGLAVYLDTSRETLMEYSERPEFVDTIKKAKERIYNFAENFLYSGKNPTGAIFNLKNNWGWKDKRELDHTSMGKQIKGFNYVPPTEDGTDNSDNQAES